MRSSLPLLVLLSPLLLGVAWAAVGDTLKTSTFTFDLTPTAGNPLKGFAPYQDSGSSNLPYSIEYDYIGMKDVMTAANTFTWTKLDSMIAGAASRGHQFVFRPYLDYPGDPNMTPQFLIDGGLTFHSYTDDGGGKSPDYENVQLRAAFKALIAAMGARYDGDKRVAFVECGLLGHWGEWHTCYLGANENTWFASATVQDEVLTAYQAAFKQTRFLISQDAMGRDTRADFSKFPTLGFHDDAWMIQTLTDFKSRLAAQGMSNRYQTAVMAGELWADTDQAFDATADSQPFSQCVTDLHATWLLSQGVFDSGRSADYLARALEGQKLMGYALYVSQVVFKSAGQGALSVEVTIQNKGVAPFYYDLYLKATASANTASPLTFTTNLNSLMPGATATKITGTLSAGSAASTSVTFKLVCAKTLDTMVIKFAQGDGSLVISGVPVDQGGTPTPVLCAADGSWPTTAAGSVAVLQCPTGQTGTQRRACLATGVWDTVSSTCSAITCAADGSWPQTQAGVTASLACPTGQAGSQTRTCGSGGTWGAVASTCSTALVYCAASGSWPKTVAGTTATLVCPVGQTGAQSRPCGANGVWGTATSTCADSCASVSCGSHGSCSAGRCTCTDGYTGTACSTPPSTASSYAWIDKMQPCDKPCGGGTQTNQVYCSLQSTGAKVDDSFCDAATKPGRVSVPCNEDACSTDCTVTFEVTSRWTSYGKKYFQASVYIDYPEDTITNGWKLTFGGPGLAIKDYWRAVVKADGTTVTATNTASRKYLPTRFGFAAKGSPDQVANFILNGNIQCVASQGADIAQALESATVLATGTETQTESADEVFSCPDTSVLLCETTMCTEFKAACARLAASQLAAQQDDSSINMTLVYAGSAGGAAVLCAVAALIVVLLVRRNRRRRQAEKTPSVSVSASATAPTAVPVGAQLPPSVAIQAAVA